MQFVWDAVNEAEIQAHQVTKEIAVALFSSYDFRVLPNSKILNRWTGEGTVGGVLYRVAFSKAFPAGVRITTAFQISRKRRQT